MTFDTRVDCIVVAMNVATTIATTSHYVTVISIYL